MTDNPGATVMPSGSETSLIKRDIGLNTGTITKFTPVFAVVFVLVFVSVFVFAVIATLFALLLLPAQVIELLC